MKAIMLGNSTVLFVDDEPFVLDALKRVFQDQGYRLLFANSAHEAIRHMEQQEIQLVVSDFRMPQMDGCELFQIVSERWPDTIRIILSGYADIKAVVSAINEGQIYKFVSKPWNNAELCEIVKSGVEKYCQLAEIRSLAEVAAAQMTFCYLITFRALKALAGVI
ncbi:MAG: response regulator [bacterium]|nr:response regulator [bacterium]